LKDKTYCLGAKMPPLSSFLRQLIIIFPIAIGLGLTGLGVFRLIQASERPASRPLAPYGILAFCSEKCDSLGLNMWLYNFDFKGNFVLGFFATHFWLSASVESNSSYEVIFGLQIPCQVEIHPNSVQGERGGVAAADPTTKEAKTVEVLEKKTVFSQVNRTSIFYVRFMTVPGIRAYSVDVTFDWRDLVNRQAFALYEIVVPFCSTTHNIAVQYFPQVHPLNYTVSNLSIEMPEGCEIRDTIPLPDKEELSSQTSPNEPEVLRPHRYLSWQLPPSSLLPEREGMWPTSDIIRVRFELLAETELHGRLLFDSGLYLGLGVGLLISGVHEAMKFATEARKKTL